MGMKLEILKALMSFFVVADYVKGFVVQSFRQKKGKLRPGAG
jgi:hypothetical protein